MATVSCTGSMLSCSTPILKGTVTGVGLLVVVKSNGSGRVGPGVLQSLDELPECSVEGRGYADLVAPAHDGSIHEVDLGLALGKNILQHAGRMLARRQGSFLHQLPWIAVQLDAERFGHLLPFRHQVVKQFSGRSEARRAAVMKQGQCSARIR